MQSIPPLTSHWKYLVSPRIIISNLIIFISFARIEEVDTMSEIYFQEGSARREGLSKRLHLSAGDIERYKPPETNNRLANL